MNVAVSTTDLSAPTPVEETVSDLSLMCLPVTVNDETRFCTWSSTVAGFLLFVGTFGFFREPLTFAMSLGQVTVKVIVLM